MGNKGVTMVELVIATLVFAIAAAGIGTGMYNALHGMSLSGYHYVALNLARKMAEFGSGTGFGHHTRMLYYYPPASQNTLASIPGCPVDGTHGFPGYALKEWRCFSIGNLNPFTNLPNLIPDYAPGNSRTPQEQRSVRIFFEVVENPSYYNALQENVVISWLSENIRHSYALSVIPISHVNNQLTLNDAQFWWVKT